MNPLLKEIRHNPLLWLLAVVPVAQVAQTLAPEAHTGLFVRGLADADVRIVVRSAVSALLAT
jgi:Ca2+:H+ antiporter